MGIRWTLALILTVLVTAGCSLISGTVRVEYDFQSGLQHSTGQNVGAVNADLTTNKNYNDNKDKIKSVDEVGFVFHAQNNLSNAATGEIWLSPTQISPATAANIRAQARRVVHGLAMNPNGSMDVSYETSLSLEDNPDYLHEVVKGGKFFLYGLADGTSTFDITVDKLTAVVLLTVEL
jgi:hypothetical protein